MAGVLIGRNTRIEVQASLGALITASAVSKANPGVVSAEGHALVAGDVVIFEDDFAGMTELAGQIARVANPVSATPDTFEVEGIDTTNFGTFTSGGLNKIATWQTLGVARSLSAGGTSPNRLDATTLLDSERQYVFGLSDQPELTVEALSDPTGAAMLVIEAAARSNTPLGFRVTMSDSSKRLFRGYVSLPSESISLDQVVTQSFSITQIRRRLAYAT